MKLTRRENARAAHHIRVNRSHSFLRRLRRGHVPRRGSYPVLMAPMSRLPQQFALKRSVRICLIAILFAGQITLVNTTLLSIAWIEGFGIPWDLMTEASGAAILFHAALLALWGAPRSVRWPRVLFSRHGVRIGGLRRSWNQTDVETPQKYRGLTCLVFRLNRRNRFGVPNAVGSHLLWEPSAVGRTSIAKTNCR
ncbi:MAG: hypothetical protein ACJAYU_000406 [Bradymonadia bacterium]|jgi:hypothetical protein